MAIIEVVGEKLRRQAQEWQVDEGEAFGLIFARSLRLLRAAMLVNTCGLVLLFRVIMIDADEMLPMIVAAIDDAHISDGLLDPQSKF